jgi:hypothetical protein
MNMQDAGRLRGSCRRALSGAAFPFWEWGPNVKPRQDAALKGGATTAEAKTEAGPRHGGQAAALQRQSQDAARMAAVQGQSRLAGLKAAATKAMQLQRLPR